MRHDLGGFRVVWGVGALGSLMAFGLLPLLGFRHSISMSCNCFRFGDRSRYGFIKSVLDVKHTSVPAIHHPTLYPADLPRR